ncbi:glycosyltransferase [Epilithonimonas hispanica]|uniref:Glycosyl transferase family 1 domain-containing protein n=1 Tax=Epilithonimonas hispanica TaxID=358687 RepID=A0A3D9CTY3_9FLAO|nr:glycosyltransferase [Epilithonimonas hispanica]REC69179.1 hypothetical protein DRF58_12590 [Epilithonimonas hispanica]
MKKILVFINYHGVLSETFIADELDFLRHNEELDIDVLHFGDDNIEEGIYGLKFPVGIIQRWKKIIRNCDFSIFKYLGYRNGINGVLPFLANFLKGKKYDTIYCHFGTNGKLIAELKKIGVVSLETKLVVRFHGLDMNFTKYSKSYYNVLVDYCDAILFGSSMAKEKLFNYGLKNNLVFLPVGIQNKNISGLIDEISNDVGSCRSFKILSVGRFIELKGHEMSVEIINKLKIENVTLKIIGEGPLFNKISKVIINKNLQGKIKLLGSQPHAFVFSELERIDVYLYSGIYDSEGRCENQATSILEAMAKGKIVLASSLGGIPDYLLENKTGFLCRPGDVMQFVEKLNWIISNFSSTTINRIRTNAINMVKENYCQEQLNVQLLEILKK